jgi:hypothetical protein
LENSTGTIDEIAPQKQNLETKKKILHALWPVVCKAAGFFKNAARAMICSKK